MKEEAGKGEGGFRRFVPPAGLLEVALVKRGPARQRAGMRGLTFFLVLAVTLAARPFTVAVYNVENLFDVDGRAVYDEYQPDRYTPAHLRTKLGQVARVLARIGDGGPDIVILAELEVDQTPESGVIDYPAWLSQQAGKTCEQLLAAPLTPEVAGWPAEAWLLKALQDQGLGGYTMVVGSDGLTPAEGGRARAIKNVVLTRFPVQAVRQHPIPGARHILEVQVVVDGQPLTIFANHWKSGAGDAAQETTRVADAAVLRARLDELLLADPHADILLGGDFNAHYNQKARYPQMRQTGINDVLRSQGNALAVRGPQRDLFNLWFELPAAERGSDVFAGEWGTLIQLIATRGLFDHRGVQYVDKSFAVAKFPGLNQADDGTPRRWTFDGPAGQGCSDHFPIYARFVTVADNAPDRWITLTRPSDGVEPATNPRVQYGTRDVTQGALTEANLPPQANLRDGTYTGKIFRVEGAVTEGPRLGVRFRGETYDIYVPDPALRAQVQTRWPGGTMARFYGELGRYKGRWQFVIKDGSWLK